MGRRASRALRAAALLLSLGAHGTASGDDAPTVFADFESEESPSGLDVGDCAATRVPAEAGGTALRWEIKAREDSAWITLEGLPPDLARFRALRLRIRIDGEARAGIPELRVRSSPRDYLSAPLAGIGREWKTLEFPFDRMWKRGEFDPKKADSVEVILWGPKDGVFLLDDLVLLPVETSAAAERPAPAKAWKEDFEDADVPGRVDSWKTKPETAGGGTPSGKAALTIEMKGGSRNPGFSVLGVPMDVRPFRTLRFLAKATPKLEVPLTVRIQNSFGEYLGQEFHDIGPQWQQYSVDLPAMVTGGVFVPERTRDISFMVFDPPAGRLWIDRIELLPGPGGWEFDEKERTAHNFGKDRAGKVAKVPTKHFDLFTDSRAAREKFTEGLETTYDFVKKTLGTPEMTEKLPVYLFQNKTLYEEFCVRVIGWTQKKAQDTGGVGSGRWFATYYQAPEAPVIAHELTHSIFHRMVGWSGGSWFQEGVAGYVEYLWQKRRPAVEFAPRLRGGQFFPLKKFLAVPVLIDQEVVTGGAGNSDSLYFQAAAFYEFLFRGPHREAWAKAQPILAKIEVDDAMRPDLVAKLLGMPIEALEKSWIEWGSKPPE
jgi:hypothetical protein